MNEEAKGKEQDVEPNCIWLEKDLLASVKGIKWKLLNC